MQAPLAMLLFYCRTWPWALIIAVVTGVITFLIGLFTGKRLALKSRRCPELDFGCDPYHSRGFFRHLMPVRKYEQIGSRLCNDLRARLRSAEANHMHERPAHS